MATPPGVGRAAIPLRVSAAQPLQRALYAEVVYGYDYIYVYEARRR